MRDTRGEPAKRRQLELLRRSWTPHVLEKDEHIPVAAFGRHKMRARSVRPLATERNGSGSTFPRLPAGKGGRQFVRIVRTMPLANRLKTQHVLNARVVLANDAARLTTSTPSCISSITRWFTSIWFSSATPR